MDRIPHRVGNKEGEAKIPRIDALIKKKTEELEGLREEHGRYFENLISKFLLCNPSEGGCNRFALDSRDRSEAQEAALQDFIEQLVEKGWRGVVETDHSDDGPTSYSVEYILLCPL